MKRWRACVIFLILLLSACNQPVEQIGSTIAVSTATREATRVVAAPRLAPVAYATTDPGIACFGSSDGLSCLTADGVWERFRRQSSPLGSNFIADLDACDDGTILIAHASGISSYDGSVWGDYDFDGLSLSSIACRSPGEFWVTYFRGAARYSDRAFRVVPASVLALGDMATDLVEAVDVGPDGVPWIVTANSIASLENDEWTIIQEGRELTRRAFFDDIVIDGSGRPWALHSGGLITNNDGYWQSYTTDLFTTATVATLDQRGRLWVGSWSDGIVMFSDGVWSYDEALNADLAGRRIQALETDASSRIWVGTDDGLFVRDDNAWRQFQAVDGGEQLLSDDIRSIAIVGSGPVLGE